MYKLSVGCLFRNESDSIIEWLEHYLLHGAEHFYLINDNSDDDSCLLLEPYVKKGLVTLFNAKWDKYLGRQHDMYNHYILGLLHESEWFLLTDMDEYMWSPKNKDMTVVLSEFRHIGQIQVDHTLFGSSDFVLQPKSIVSSFIKRSRDCPTESPGNRKYFVNCSFKFTSLNIHHATFVNKDDEINRFLLLNNYFRLNHYCCQSRDFWNNIKCRRGDGDCYRSRTEAEFNDIDVNDVEDIDLKNQNNTTLKSSTP